MKIPLTKKRQDIEQLIVEGKFDEIGNLPDFTIFEIRDPKEDTEKEYGCVTWVFSGDKKKVEEFTSNPLSPPGYVEVQNPQTNDLVSYFRKGRFHRCILQPDVSTHLGVYISNWNIRSKFRESHVYEHFLRDVPAMYGTEVKFFRKTLLSQIKERILKLFTPQIPLS